MGLLAWFKEIQDEDLVHAAGGKGASLCRMSHQDLPVPEGFVIKSGMFNYFAESSGLLQTIRELLDQIDWENNNSNLCPISTQIKDLISKTPMPDSIAEAIKEYYEDLGNDVPVAVRSSGTVEDLEDASCAGQQDTYLFVIGVEDVLKYIKDCWASLYNDRAIFYRHQKGFDSFEISIAVVVQRMVNAEKAGVIFSANPITSNRDEVVIEAAWGLGESVVQGIVTPDNYWVKKGTYQIVNEYIAEKETMVVRLSEQGGVKETPVPPDLAEKPVLSEQELKELVDIAVKVEKFYGKPQDLEWAYENNKLYLLQSRPITTLAKTNL